MLKSNNHSTFNQPLYVTEISMYDLTSNSISNLLGSLNFQKLKILKSHYSCLSMISVSLHII